MTASPVICALDTTDTAEALAWATAVSPYVWGVKLGLAFFTANGAAEVIRLKEKTGLKLFLDLKFHDIPNTVAGAVRAAIGIGAEMLTIHASGGGEMMKAAQDAASDESAKRGVNTPLILGVTVLTSMSKEQLSSIQGVSTEPAEQVVRLAGLAKQSGLGGCVCSAHEIELIRSTVGQGMKLVVPGIRRASDAVGDQRRVLGPREAMQKGADYLVVGRPITGHKDVAGAAQAFFAEAVQ